MVNRPASACVFDAACSLLARRPHSRMELKRKLARKNFLTEDIEKTLEKLCRQGYLNDEDVSYRWAQSLVQNRRWGKAKVTAYLQERGISPATIQKVQTQIWQEYSEEEVGRKALEKHFFSTGVQASTAQKARFLKSRGFSADVIYALVSATDPPA